MNHEGIMVPTMSPTSWCFVSPPIELRPQQLRTNAAVLFRHHEGFMVPTMNPLTRYIAIPRIR
jgi:hypothetical protein